MGTWVLKTKEIVDWKVVDCSTQSNRTNLLINMSTLTQARMEVEQLRREAAIKRIPVSQVVEDIKKYIYENQPSDCLVEGFGRQSSNPFREKSSCQVL